MKYLTTIEVSLIQHFLKYHLRTATTLTHNSCTSKNSVPALEELRAWKLSESSDSQGSL